MIADAAPGPGAGNIETPGRQDIYTFVATEGQVIYFDEQEGDLWWELFDAAGNEIFSLINTDKGPITLAGGTYILTADPPGDRTGTYRFQLVAQ